LAVNTWNYYTYVDGIVLKRSWAGEGGTGLAATTICERSMTAMIEARSASLLNIPILLPTRIRCTIPVFNSLTGRLVKNEPT
jgi:hypothetical protein